MAFGLEMQQGQVDNQAVIARGTETQDPTDDSNQAAAADHEDGRSLAMCTVYDQERQASSRSGDNDQPRRRKGGLRTIPFIFGNEISEKLAAIGFGANMVVFLTEELHLDYVKAATTLTNFSGTSSLTPLIGAFLADAYVGRFWMITVSTVIYFLGMSLLTLTAIQPTLHPPPCKGVGGGSCEGATRGQLAVVFGGLTLTALGGGGIRPCVAAFGADQFEDQGASAPKSNKLWSFFNWYYFCMGTSALLAVTLIVWVQDNVGWGLGFGIPTTLMLLSGISFILGFSLYIQIPPMGSPLARLAHVLVAAFRKRHLLHLHDPIALYELNDKELALVASKSRLQHTSQFRFLDKAAMRREGDVREDGRVDPWRLCTVTEVEELKTIMRMFPIWAAGILLVTASAQQNTFSLLQARTLDRRFIRASSFQIPAGSMTVFSITAMLLTITLYDRVFMRMARRVTGHPRGITFLQRMSVGFVLSTVATAAAALVEVKRKHAAAHYGLLDSPKALIPMPVFWLVPQYALHGIAEAFMSIGHLEFFYDQSPESMRSTATALFWTSISMGNYLSSFLVSMVKHYTPWLPSNLNRGHLDSFYWLLTFLQFFNLLVFFISARWYRYKLPIVPDNNHLQAEDADVP